MYVRYIRYTRIMKVVHMMQYVAIILLKQVCMLETQSRHVLLNTVKPAIVSERAVIALVLWVLAYGHK